MRETVWHKSVRHWRAVQVMANTTRPPRGLRYAARRMMTASGAEFDVYEPAGIPLKTAVLVTGMGVAGEKDVRLLRFVYACVHAGLRMVVPVLPGQKACIIDAGDLLRMIDIFKDVSANFGAPFEVVAFSMGGSYTIAAAAQTDISNYFDKIMLFSAVYDVRAAWERLHDRQKPPPVTTKEWDAAIWTQSVIVLRNMDLLQFSAQQRQEHQHFLLAFDDFTPDERKGYYQRVIAPLRLLERNDLFDEGAVMATLSARDHAKHVKCPVFIVHDVSDDVVLSAHAQEMYAELRQRAPGSTQKILVTRLLTHVSLQNPAGLGELSRFISILAELF